MGAKRKSISPIIRSFEKDINKSKIFNMRSKYHYTSPEALLSILQNNCIRFTDVRYMNDKAETVFFYKLLIEYLREHKQKYPYCEECTYRLIKGNSIDDILQLRISDVKLNYNFRELNFTSPLPQNKRHFVFCTCNEEDSLNMWNYYVKNGNYQGYNIGININKILKVFDNINVYLYENFNVYYGKVLYQKTDQYRAIKEFLDTTESQIQKYITLLHSNSMDIEEIMLFGEYCIYDYIESCAVFYKHPNFSSEKEFRVVVEISEDYIPHDEKEAINIFGEEYSNMYEGFATKQGLIVPFFQVSIPDEAITQITISPITEFDIAKKSIEELLCVKGINKVTVKKSDIPIRF